MKGNLTKYLIGFTLLLLLLQQITITNSTLIDQYYTNGLYTVFLAILTPITNLFPFSLGDILYGIVVVLLILKTITILKQQQSKLSKLKHLGLFALNIALVFYLSFSLFWGLNNYKTPIHSSLDLTMGYEKEELVNLTNRIIATANQQQLQLTNDSLKAVKTTRSKDDILADTSQGIKDLGKETNWFSYKGETVKKSIYSLPLTYMGFSGYLNPFTLEAQINDKVPALTLIVTSSHEMAHQLGYAKESEANFIGFLASQKQKELIYQYAANIYALRYCINTLAKEEESEIVLEQIINSLNPGVYQNLIENKEFWDNYKTITDSIFKFIYSNFLKINNQKEGIQSYNRFVDLLIQYDTKQPIYPTIN